jgi:hypothetical protein
MGELLLATLARPARAFNRIDIEREAMVCHCDLLPIELQLDDSAYGAGSCSRLIRQLVLNTQHDISQIVDDGADCVCSCRHSANYLLSLSLLDLSAASSIALSNVLLSAIYRCGGEMSGQ